MSERSDTLDELYQKVASIDTTSLSDDVRGVIISGRTKRMVLDLIKELAR